MATDFGKRVAVARKHAGFTQKTLAPLVGMSQSNLSELETVAYESGKTAQIARTCGVNAYWLATGEGEMLGGVIVAPPTPALTPSRALPIVLDALMAAPEPQREELALVLGLFLRTGATSYRKRLAELLDAAPAPWNGLERRTGTDRRAPTLPEANTGKFAA